MGGHRSTGSIAWMSRADVSSTTLTLSEEIAPRHVVREFYEDFQGNLLVGYAQGLYKMDRASGRLSRVWNSPRSSFSESSNKGVQWLPGRGVWRGSRHCLKI